MNGNQEFDEYGFLVASDENDGDLSDERCHGYSPQPSEEVARQWTETLDSWDQDSPHKVRQLLRKGLPRSLRSRAWQLFLDTHTLRAQSDFSYQAKLMELQAQLRALGVSEYSSEQDIRTLNGYLEQPSVEIACQGVDLKTIRQIMMDIGRSFPCHRLFRVIEAPGRLSLLHMLAVYAAYNPAVGYCQGMAYIGGLLLMNMDEEDAFWALLSLCESPKYLAGYYDASMSRLQTHAAAFALVLQEKLPNVAKHLEELGIHPLLYMTSWFMCLLTSLPCWDTVLAVCDLLFFEGINTIFRVALAIMKVCAPELVAMYRIEQALPFLQHLPSRLVSQGHLLPVLWRTSLDESDMVQYLAKAHTQRSSEGRSSRKRSAPTDTMEAETPRATKRRKGVETPVVSKPSLLTRFKNAFTPAKTPLTGRQAPHMQTPALNDLSTPSYRSSRKRKRKCHGDESFDLSLHTPCIQGSGDIELTDFIVSMDTPPNKLFVDSPRSTMFPLERLTPLIENNGSPRLQSPLCQSPRRSIRIAKRRSICQQVASPRHLPSAAVLSPLSVRPLQDHLLTSNHHGDHHAFRIFTTPTPARTHSQACMGLSVGPDNTSNSC